MRPVTWRWTNQVETYTRWTWPLLAGDPVRNTIALTVIENLRAGRSRSSEPMTFGWFMSGDVTVGAVSRTPPFEWLLADVPPCAIGPLADALVAQDAVVAGVKGETAVVHAFATAWTSRRPTSAVPGQLDRLYQLGTLLPARPTAGRARPAAGGDLAVAADWWTRFQLEMGGHVVDVEVDVRDRIEGQRLWLWEDRGGRAVSVAGCSRTAAGVARVGPVYTPPEHRRRGYGAAVTAACTGDALRRGARDVVLFADLANPTSNAIYQQIGYRAVHDELVIHFENTVPGGPAQAGGEPRASAAS